MIRRHALALLAAAAFAPAARAAPPAIVSEGPAGLTQSHQFILHSASVRRDFLIEVSEPIQLVREGAKVPVVYLLDGTLFFNRATSIVRAAPEGQLEPAFIIAIGYPPNSPGGALRQTDYVHRPYRGADQGSFGGGGAAFEKFVLTELRPFIEARYMIDPARSYIAGHSFGGLFVANLLVRQPESFVGYIIGSPPLWEDDSVVQRAMAIRRGGGRRVYVGVGGKEDVNPSMVDLAEDLAHALSRPATGLVVTEKTYSGETHMTVAPLILADGLRQMLARPAP